MGRAAETNWGKGMLNDGPGDPTPGVACCLAGALDGGEGSSTHGGGWSANSET